MVCFLKLSNLFSSIQPYFANSYFHIMKPACFILLLTFICSFSVFAQNAQDTIVVLPIKMEVPGNAVKKGSIKAGNNATDTHCNYEDVVASAKEKAGKMGGNIVKITQLIPPAFVSKCYRINADVYYSPTPPKMANNQTTGNAQAGKPAGYALLYIYRLADTIMMAPSYHLHLNGDSAICFVRNKSRDSVKIYKDGSVLLWGKTQHKGELKLDVKFGEKYYIRCGLKGTQFSMTPVIEQVDANTGAAEYSRSKNRKKEQSVKYLQEMH